MADLCDVYTRARLLIRLSDNNPTQPHRDCSTVPPLFESETSVCTLVSANPEYYAGGSTAGRTEGGGGGGGPNAWNSPQGSTGALSETEKFPQRRSAPRTARQDGVHALRTDVCIKQEPILAKRSVLREASPRRGSDSHVSNRTIKTIRQRQSFSFTT